MILVAGSANLDFVVRAARIPGPGETVLGSAFANWPGGKGANQAVACARAGGAATQMLLALGADPFAAALEDSLRAAGVVPHVVRVAQPTGCAFICVTDDGENAITVAPGANACLAPQHLPALAGCSQLLLQLETPLPTVTAYARAARDQGVAVVLNAAPAQPLPGELLALVDLLLVNEGELTALAGAQGSVAQRMQRLPVPAVVVTLGARGCCARWQGQLLVQPAFAITPVDTTAAGDTFCGVLAAAIDRGADMAHALQLASAAAALACTRAGAQASIPDAGEVARFLAQQTPASDCTLAALRQFCGLD